MMDNSCLLVLIQGFGPGTTAKDLGRHLVSCLLPVKNVWLETKEPRAVALFGKETDLHALRTKLQNNIFQGNILLVEEVKPTNSIACIANLTTKALKDKLFWRFQKQPVNSKIVNIKCLGEQDADWSNHFQIEFAGGWDAVLKACDARWTLEGSRLRVRPYFDCLFAENFESQQRRLREEYDLTKTTESSKALPPVNRSVTVDGLDSSKPLSALTPLRTAEPDVSEKTDASTPVTIVLDPFFTHLLHLLKFNSQEVEMILNPFQGEILMNGPPTKIDTLQNLLTAEDEKLEEESCKDFFQLEEWTDILSHLVDQNQDSVFVHHDKDGEPCLLVSCGSKKLHLKDYLCDLKDRHQKNQKQAVSLIPQTSQQSEPDADPILDTTFVMDPFFAHILYLLQFQGEDVSVNLSPDEGEILMKGHSSKIMSLQNLLTSEDEKLDEEEKSKDFLQSEEVKPTLCRLINQTEGKASVSHDVNGKLALWISTPSKKFTLQDYLSHLMDQHGQNKRKTEKPIIPPKQASNAPPRTTTVFPKGKAEPQPPTVQASIPTQGRAEIKDEPQVIHSNSSDDDESYEMVNQSIEKHLFMKKYEIQVLKQFMAEKVKNIEKKKTMHNCEITFEEKSIKITSDSTHTTTVVVPDALKELVDEIQVVEKPVDFPGIARFLGSEEGIKMVSDLSHHFECLIEPMTTAEEPSRDTTVLQLARERVLSVPMIGHAIIRNFTFVVMQCTPKEIDVEMEVTFIQTLEGSEVKIQTISGSSKVQILLPPVSKASNIPRMRANMEKGFKQMVDQMVYLGHKTASLSFDTPKGLPNAPRMSFPVNVVAKEFVSMLQKLWQKVTTQLTFVLCEPSEEAIVKAFTFHITQYMDSPLPNIWTQISLPEGPELLDYHRLKRERNVSVTVKSSLPWGHSADVICCPFDLTEEGKVYCEYINDEQQRAVRELERRLQHDADNLALNKIFRMAHSSPTFFFYFSQTWGFDVNTAISGAMMQLLKTTANAHRIYIVPPCLSQDKNSVEFVARQVFCCLDQFFSNETMAHGSKEIHLLVKDKDIAKVYNHQLELRLPKRRTETEKSTNFVPSLPKDSSWHNNSQSVPIVYKDKRTEVRFIGLNQASLQKASNCFDDRLRESSRDNEIALNLNVKKTRALESLLKKGGDFCVDLKGEKMYIRSKKNKQILKSAHVTFSGLKKQFVREFLAQAGISDSTSALEDVEMKEANASDNPEVDQMEIGRTESNVDLCCQEDMEWTSHPNCLETGAGNNSVPSSVVNSMMESTGAQGDEGAMQETAATRDVDIKKVNASFGWCYEERNENGTLVFHDFDFARSKELESAFIRKYETSVVKNFGKADLKKMTVKDPSNTTVGIIRKERIMESSTPCTFPDTWSEDGKDVSLRKVEDRDSPEFKAIENALKSVHNLEVDLLRIDRIKNKELYQRFKAKAGPTTESVDMWARPSKEKEKQICQFGFHYIFTEKIEVPHMKGGVTFYQNCGDCLKKTDKGQDVCLIKAMVLKSTPGQGDPKSGSSVDANEPSGIWKDGQCTLFSDALAYPAYVVRLHVEDDL